MGLFDQFPYTNFHELNLDWVLQALKELEHTIEQFVAINALKYADPIQWDITSQYEKNTIVIDPQSGTAYISVQAVPSGVALTNTDYWTVVFDLEQFVTKANNNFTIRVEEQTTLNATFATNKGEWVIWGGVLYEALSNIIAGDQYVENSNIKRITVEDITGDLIDLDTVNKTNLVAAINEIFNAIGDISNLSTTDKTSLVNAINETYRGLTAEIQNRIDAIAAEAQTRADNDTAIINNFNGKIGDLDNLNTVAKNNLVSAINEVNTKASAANYYVTPEDYGAQGGNADDTAAVQAAINDGRPVIFTQNYNVSHLDIKYDSARTFFLDGQDFWLIYNGTNETSMIKFSGVTATIKNLNITNTTNQNLTGIEWTSEAVDKPSEFNTFDNIKIYNFETAIYYGDVNHVIDTSQSENSIIGLVTRGCNLNIYCYMANATLNVSNSQLICTTAESNYTFDEDRSGIIWCYDGIVHVVNSSLVKPTIQRGTGLIGKNIVLDDCIIEIASRIANCTGDITINNSSGGYYSNVNNSPFTVDPSATGKLTLFNYKLRFSALSNVKLVSATASSLNKYAVIMDGCYIENHVATRTAPISDYQVYVNNCFFNTTPLADTRAYDFAYFNYKLLTVTNANTAMDTNGDITITPTGSGVASITTDTYNCSGFANVQIQVIEATSDWRIVLAITDIDGNAGYAVLPVTAGMQSASFMAGSDNITKVQLIADSQTGSGTFKFRLIHVNAM